MIERILHRIEDHVEEWRRQDAARKAEAASHREELWAEAAERQKLLAEAIAEQEPRPTSIEEMTRQHPVAFVLHREDLTGTLETFASEKDRLVNVVSGKNHGFRTRSSPTTPCPDPATARVAATTGH